jgi:hypothetical protein
MLRPRGTRSSSGAQHSVCAGYKDWPRRVAPFWEYLALPPSQSDTDIAQHEFAGS